MSNVRPRDGGAFKFSKTAGQMAFSGNLSGNQPLSRISQDRRSWATGTSTRSSMTNKNFIKLNADRAIASRARRPLEQKRVDSPHGTRVSVDQSGQVPSYRNKSDYGKVPKYMRRRKVEEVQETKDVVEKVEEIINIDEQLRYSDDEREKVVLFLQEYHDKLNSKYQTLPLFIDTIGMRQRKNELEGLMDEVQRAILYMESSNNIYKSDFPPQRSRLREQWDELMQEHAERLAEEEEAAKFQPGVHYSVVW